ncbi:MAG: hypothetical protein PF448_02115 [Bacteroidales bacterium]|jgi:hypothetical protein|nr:hypothetical protein [Bacteroidales bacterium]
MKRLSLILILGLFGITSLFAQKNVNYEVLYFKANLSCCQARACDALQKDIESTLQSIFDEESINFKVVKLADEANKDLVETYNAKSQTVVCIKTKRKKTSSVDLSEIVKQYRIHRDKEKLATALKAEIVKMN